MFRKHASLVGGPLDGAEELLDEIDWSSEEIRVLSDFTEALIGSCYIHYWPLTPARHDSIAERLLRLRKDDPNHGWQTLLYRRGSDGRYDHLKKERPK